jgi:hypothetical protein
MQNKWFLLLFIFVVLSCGRDRLKINVPDIEKSFEVQRLDADLNNAKTEIELKAVHEKYGKQHEEFYNFFLGACLRVGLYGDSLTFEGLQDFLKDDFIQKLQAEIQNEFVDVKTYTEAFHEASAYLKYHLPEAPLPKHIIFYNSLFANSVVSSENTIGIGLERYLGENSPSIKELPNDPYYPYIKRRMDRQFIARDMMMSWIGSNVFDAIDENADIANVMIQWGKQFYLLEACYPNIEMHLILRYFSEEMDWAMNNERHFWDYLVQQNVLFKRDYKMALNIFSDGPFTSGLPISDKAPPRLGQFLGWRMVKKFMDKNKKISLNELMTTDYKKIIKAYN